MRICIVDPACHVPSLKTLFPEAEFFSHEPDEFFRFGATNHATKEENFKSYHFYYRTDWEAINSNNFDTLFIVAPLLDYYTLPGGLIHKPQERMRNKIREILEKNTFQKVALFDIYDYDYDPNNVGCEWKVDIFFKRNYVRHRVYKANVFPFPFMMFLKPCVLGLVLESPVEQLRQVERIHRCFWAGALYNHNDTFSKITRNRLDMYNDIKSYVDTYSLSEADYLKCLKSYSMAVDLIGVGNPNKRTFEILHAGTLLLSMNKELVWPFEKEDIFEEETFFSTKDEFKEKLFLLLTNQEVFHRCLLKQYFIVNKYFNKEYLSSYIMSHIHNT